MTDTKIAQPSLTSTTIVRLFSVAVVFAVGARLIQLSQNRTFFFDEWDFVLHRSEFSFDSLLRPHNGHPSVIPAAAYLVFLRFFGLGSYELFVLTGIFVHIVVMVLVGKLVARHSPPRVVIAAMLAVGLLGTGWQNSLWPFQIGFMGSVAAFLASLVLLGDQPDSPSSANLRVAALVLTVGVLCSSVGVAAFTSIGLMTLGDRDRRPRQWWVALPAAATYLAWYLSVGSESTLTLSLSPTSIAEYVVHAAALAASSLVAVDQIWGAVAVGALVVIAGLRLKRLTRPLRSAMLAPATFLLCFWALTAISRGQLGEPGASRYTYIGATGLTIIATHVSRHHEFATKLLTIGLISSVFLTNSNLVAGANGLKYEAEVISAELDWIEEHADRVPIDLIVDPQHAPQVSVGDYLEAKARLGGSASQLKDNVPLSRGAAESLDSLVARSWVLRSEPVVPSECVSSEYIESIQLTPGSSIRLSASTDSFFTMSRFSVIESPPIPLIVGQTMISVPADKWSTPWTLKFAPGGVILCDRQPDD